MFSSNRNKASPSDTPSGSQLSVATIALDRETQRLLKLWLSSANVHELGHYPEGESFNDWIGNPSIAVCFVDFDKNASKAFSVAERIHQDSPETAIFAISSEALPDVIIQAMGGGCREHLFKPLVREHL